MSSGVHGNGCDCPYCASYITIGVSTGATGEVVKASIDLNHPLLPFFLKIIEEYDRGKDKYGEWKYLDDQEQKDAVKSEALEWEAASLSKKHTHREREELTHLGNVAGKRWLELQKKGRIA